MQYQIDRKILIEIRKALANLYPEEFRIRRIVTDAGINLLRIKFNHTAIDTWNSVLEEAYHVNRVDDLLAVAEEEYSSNKALHDACIAYRRAISQADHIDTSLRSFTKEDHAQQNKYTANNPSSEQTVEQGITQQDTETTNNETIHLQHLQVENLLRSYPDFFAILRKCDFVPSESRNGRELTVVRPKVAVRCKLPIAISGGSCLIEFSDPFLRGLTISLEHKDVLQQLLAGRHTHFRSDARKFISVLNNEKVRLSIGSAEVLLSQTDATDLCECIDKVVDDYVASMMKTENALEAWNRPIGRQYKDSDNYGYEILTVSVDTWKQMLQIARNSAEFLELKYHLYALNESFQIESGFDIHAHIAPKLFISHNGLPTEEIRLLYLVSPTYSYEDTWQNKVGPKGLWTARFAKDWLLKKFVPLLQNPSAADDLEPEATPNVFWDINEPRLFSYHLRTIHPWAWTNGNKPTDLFINYCQAFNQLLNQATIEDRTDSWGYILKRLPIFKNKERSTNKNNLTFVREELQDILISNLKYLQQIEYIPWEELDSMFRGHCALIEDFKINSTQFAINDFKKVLWKLYERASFENRFCYLE